MDIDGNPQTAKILILHLLTTSLDVIHHCRITYRPRVNHNLSKPPT